MYRGSGKEKSGDCNPRCLHNSLKWLYDELVRSYWSGLLYPASQRVDWTHPPIANPIKQAKNWDRPNLSHLVHRNKHTLSESWVQIAVSMTNLEIRLIWIPGGGIPGTGYGTQEASGWIGFSGFFPPSLHLPFPRDYQYLYCLLPFSMHFIFLYLEFPWVICIYPINNIFVFCLDDLF
jgi:hypothetical protein